MNLQKSLYDRHGITVLASQKEEQLHWLRVSTHIYNGFDQIDCLVGVLTELRERGKA